MSTTEQRRICWPDPDATCLEGGCLYCNDHPYRAVSTIRRWAERQTEPIPNRATGTTTALEAFQFGSRHRWGNANSRLIRRAERL